MPCTGPGEEASSSSRGGVSSVTAISAPLVHGWTMRRTPSTHLSAQHSSVFCKTESSAISAPLRIMWAFALFQKTGGRLPPQRVHRQRNFPRVVRERLVGLCVPVSTSCLGADVLRPSMCSVAAVRVSLHTTSVCCCCVLLCDLLCVLLCVGNVTALLHRAAVAPSCRR